ncbi:MAG: hypothetical protein JKP98_13770 [Rhodobacteraceae bacterium]|nr:hypothetical protein [Paracoccaceae bacterium]
MAGLGHVPFGLPLLALTGFAALFWLAAGPRLARRGGTDVGRRDRLFCRHAVLDRRAVLRRCGAAWLDGPSQSSC